MVIGVPESVDNEVARQKLFHWGFEIDTLTDEQEKYLNSWNVE